MIVYIKVHNRGFGSRIDISGGMKFVIDDESKIGYFDCSFDGLNDIKPVVSLLYK